MDRVVRRGFGLDVRAVLVAVAVTALSVGCSSAGPVSGPAGSDGADSEGVVASRDGGVTSANWVPRQQIDHKTYSDQERLEWREWYLDMRANEGEGVQDPPEVPLVRWTESLQEYDEAMAQCLTDGGFPAQVGILGGIVYAPSVPSSQEAALDLVQFECEAKYTPLPAIMTNWSAEQKGMLFDYWVEAMIPCLEAHGIYPADAPVSRETFMEIYPHVDWDPELLIVDVRLSETDNYEITAKCPPYPPAKYFYGS